MNRALRSLAAAAAALMLLIPAVAQSTRTAAEDGVRVYHREVFTYQRGGRPDPFQPLLRADDMALRVEDLRVSGITYSPNARESMVVFVTSDDKRRLRMRVGDRVGNMTVARIYPRRVDVRVDELGVSRTHTLEVQRVQQLEPGSDGGADAPAQQQPQQVSPQPRQPGA